MKKILSLASMVGAAAVLGGGALAQDFVFGITFDAGGKFDASFNEGTWNGLVRAVDELSATYEVDILEYEPSSGGFTADGQRQMAGQQGAELIIAPGFNQQDAIVANQLPEVHCNTVCHGQPLQDGMQNPDVVLPVQCPLRQ